jgi:hypothetical protein
VGAENVRGGLVESGEIQRPGTGPDGGGEGWRTDTVRFKVRGTRFEGRSARFEGGRAEREDAVLVGFAEGRVAGVEVGGDSFDCEDADAWGKAAVEGAVQVGGGDGRGEREAGDLGESVDTGVGAS